MVTGRDDDGASWGWEWVACGQRHCTAVCNKMWWPLTICDSGPYFCGTQDAMFEAPRIRGSEGPPNFARCSSCSRMRPSGIDSDFVNFMLVAIAGASGYGFRLSPQQLKNVVKCSNTVLNANNKLSRNGYANVPCQS